MNVYIWERLAQLTGSYHSGGGAVVVADSLEAARQMVLGYYAKEMAHETDPEPCDVTASEPDAVYPCEAAEPRLFVFPNAGCC